MVDKDVVRRRYDGLAETYAAERDPDSREGAVLEHVLEQLSRPARVLDVGCGQGEFARVLRPNGLLVVSEGTNDWQGTNPDWLESGVEMQWHIAGADRTRAQLRRAGFTIHDERLIPDELADEESLWTFFVAQLEA